MSKTVAPMEKSNKRIPNKPFRLAASERIYDNRPSRRVPAWFDSGNVRLTTRHFEISPALPMAWVTDWPCPVSFRMGT